MDHSVTAFAAQLVRAMRPGLGMSLLAWLTAGAQVPQRNIEIVTSPANEHYRSALRFGSDGDLARARQELAAVLRADPTHTSATYRLRTLDDVDARVIPAATAVRLFKATRLSEDGRHADAIAELDAGIALSPRYPEAHRLRGRVRVNLGDIDGAIRDYGRAIELAPAHASAYANRAAAFLRKGELERALADFGEAIRLRPSDAELYATRGVVHVMRGTPSQAMADFDRALQLDPGLGPAYLNKAQLQENMGDTAAAILTLKALLRNARPAYRKDIEYAKNRLEALERS